MEETLIKLDEYKENSRRSRKANIETVEISEEEINESIKYIINRKSPDPHGIYEYFQFIKYGGKNETMALKPVYFLIFKKQNNQKIIGK